MLHPNVAINRRYRNMSTGQEVGFLFVQCDDARAIMDHYPPICYVVQGYDKDAVRPKDWKIGGAPEMTITGTEYEFNRRQLTEESGIIVDNFIVMPDGTIRRDMEEAKIAAGDQRRRFFGAAQCQLVFQRGVALKEREAVFDAFARACRPTIEAVESGLIH